MTCPIHSESAGLAEVTMRKKWYVILAALLTVVTSVGLVAPPASAAAAKFIGADYLLNESTDTCAGAHTLTAGSSVHLAPCPSFNTINSHVVFNVYQQQAPNGTWVDYFDTVSGPALCIGITTGQANAFVAVEPSCGSTNTTNGWLPFDVQVPAAGLRNGHYNYCLDVQNYNVPNSSPLTDAPCVSVGASIPVLHQQWAAYQIGTKPIHV
jgi:hypothetical protein